MKNLIVYDSQHGNTEKVALAITKSLPTTKAVKISEVNLSDLEKLDLLIVGSPTQGGRPTKDVQRFINQLPPGKLGGIKVAAFDTRFLEKDLNFALRLLVKTIGYAAPKIAKTLVNKGGELIVPPQGFIVEDTKGPLAPGELERASEWVKNI